MKCTTLAFYICAAAFFLLPACTGKNSTADTEDTPVLLQEENANPTTTTTTTTDAAKPAAGEYRLEEDSIKKETPVVVKEVIVPEKLPLKKVGELVLKDSIKVYNDEVVSFMLLDSLLSPRRSSRDFYFKVFNKLMDRSGGKMGDAIGDYALTYVESYPREFLTNSRNFSEDRLASWASNIGIELYLGAGDTRQAYEKSTKQFMANCKKCDTADLVRLQNFNQMIWTTIEQNLQKRKP